MATQRDAVKAQHDFAEWPGAEGPPLRRRFLPDLDRVPRFSHESRRALPGGAFIDHFTEAGSGRVSVRVVQFATPREAQEGLVDILENSMAVELPRCEERGLALGDVCFCDLGEEPIFVAFTRANVLIRVDSSGLEPVPVSPVAIEIDRQLSEAIEAE